ncbi:MAG: hypothetical protein JXA93_06645 [Anaerolineae bacterium]|nr:hypothetical protein [Anaerolineae bacterium]
MNLVTILILATLVEALVEFFIQPAVKPVTEAVTMQPEPATDWRGMILRWSAAAVGIALCILYQVDLLALFGLECPVPVVGWIVTGLLIARGANWLNDFSDRWLRR